MSNLMQYLNQVMGAVDETPQLSQDDEEFLWVVSFIVPNLINGLQTFSRAEIFPSSKGCLARLLANNLIEPYENGYTLTPDGYQWVSDNCDPNNDDRWHKDSGFYILEEEFEEQNYFIGFSAISAYEICCENEDESTEE